MILSSLRQFSISPKRRISLGPMPLRRSISLNNYLSMSKIDHRNISILLRRIIVSKRRLFFLDEALKLRYLFFRSGLLKTR